MKIIKKNISFNIQNCIINSLILLIYFFELTNSYATPQIALHTRNRCINCHLNETGSGVRNEYGWATVRDFSLVSLSDWDFLYYSNSLLDEKLYLGCDIRGQLARSFKPNSVRRFFVKEIAVHSSFDVANWLSLEGSYNFADIVYRNHGQQSWTASAVLDIMPDFPRLRLGKFQPAIGVRYDDHTMLIRNFANPNIFAKPIVAIDYSEYGCEINYTFQNFSPYFIFNLSGGIFASANLNKVQFSAVGGELPLVNSNEPSFLVRAIMNEITGFSDFTTTYVGISYFHNSDLNLINAFSGLNIYEFISVLFEYMLGKKSDLLDINNFLAIFNFHIFKPLFFELRYEQAQTFYNSLDLKNVSNQAVAGMHFFPLPYIELKAEMRYMKTQETPQILNQYEGLLYYLQIHCFY